MLGLAGSHQGYHSYRNEKKMQNASSLLVDGERQKLRRLSCLNKAAFKTAAKVQMVQLSLTAPESGKESFSKCSIYFL